MINFYIPIPTTSTHTGNTYKENEAQLPQSGAIYQQKATTHQHSNAYAGSASFNGVEIQEAITLAASEYKLRRADGAVIQEKVDTFHFPASTVFTLSRAKRLHTEITTAGRSVIEQLGWTNWEIQMRGAFTGSPEELKQQMVMLTKQHHAPVTREVVNDTLVKLGIFNIILETIEFGDPRGNVQPYTVKAIEDIIVANSFVNTITSGL